jgi:hypothetical protein
MYVYDIMPKKKEELGKIKRRFYYKLAKTTPFTRRTTKSVILTTKEHEKTLDSLFLSFKDNIVVYKCKITSLEIFGQTQRREI